ncbi:unnamed protein product [Peronospora belbahrii]|uniref:GDP/GTP exchange factor Sec2 N-terminal domain-containing protein n=1 Tax=Peronospora belbahrii TaxID=622444 RepID=A0AAU9KXW1_9STRA|nr:unnamed protein product [Peronospora belbahrii]CAH0520437.1 unnamed protein product [Peronospora belbahrii]
MTSSADLQAQNEHMKRKIHALLSANTTLEKEVVELALECDELQFTATNKQQILEQEIEAVDKELTSLRSQCQSVMTKIVNKVDAQIKTELKQDETPMRVSHKLSSAFNHTLQHARNMSMSRERQSSTAKMVAHGLIKASSYMTLPTGNPSHFDAPRRPKMNKESPPILSYTKSAYGSTKTLLFSTHSHYDNFRRRSGNCRKSYDPVMVL